MTDFIPPPADDAVEHLWNAAHEFLRAMRALVDAADEFVEQQRVPRVPVGEHNGRVHHINIDVDAQADVM